MTRAMKYESSATLEIGFAYNPLAREGHFTEFAH